MEFIKNEFIDDEVLLMYRCGSYAFGTSNENSDEDYIVVLKDFKGMTHRNNEKKEYFIKCCAKNSRQIAVLLENFHFEVQKSKGAKTVRVSALNEKDSCCCVGKVQVSARTAMAPQIIEPRKLQFFTVRIDTADPEIQYAKLTLCAYDEDGKLHKFLVYNGLKVKRPPAHTPKD